ncbi:PREDICTED: 11-beta-hydroxysteroid dehydrogenase 1B-like isoform X2 [Nelumbo nucifera]|uniref:11-beta-hydroxysteroid dehydrogenase 1B-like isoform X2 n=1 Tax=Nelumbo nucifera TaxID=4432 RepID=A0A1U8B4R4_NELNU|nr:PREDICTED: 11-beta-hydroxysteroid dehydrogenase 1B-like isoform X2 [Nelumbo nucifera]
MEFVHLLMKMVSAPLALIILLVALPFLSIHLAYEYAKKGAFLVLVARREEMLEQVAKKAGQLGSPDVLEIRADVSQVDECKRFVQETVRRFGRLDHLVCNAGIASYCKFEDGLIGFSNFRIAMDTNFWGYVYPTYFAIPHLKKSKGKIIVNASVASWFITPYASSYGASKAALVNFFDTLRVELAPEIKITIAAPGFTESEMINNGKNLTKEGVVEDNPEMIEVLVGKFPIRRVGVCAEAIVNGACCGERYVIEPSWYKMFINFQFFCPEIVEWFIVLWFYITKSDTS